MSDSGSGVVKADETKNKLPDFADLHSASTAASDSFLDSTDDGDSDEDTMVAFGNEADELFEQKAKPTTPAQSDRAAADALPAIDVSSDAMDGSSGVNGSIDASLSDANLSDANASSAEPIGADAAQGKEKAPTPDTKTEPGGEVKKSEQNDRSLKQVANFDRLLPDGMKKLDQNIANAFSREERTDLSLVQSHTQTLQVLEEIGKVQAAKPAESNQASLELKLVELQTNEQSLLEGRGIKSIELRSVQAQLLIGSGKDESIRAGEKMLAELVRDNPSLATNTKFQEQLINTYSDMSKFRELRNLPPWKCDLKLDDVVPLKIPGTANGGKSVGDLVASASKTYFDQGIEKALPAFQKAEEKASIDLNLADRKRVSLFIEGLSQNATMAQTALEGKDIKELIEKRLDTADQELQAIKASSDAKMMCTAVGINRSFARIATGDAEQAAEGKKELAELMKINPGLTHNAEFNTNAKNAFRAHFEAKHEAEKAKQAGTDKPTVPAPGPAGDKVVARPGNTGPKYGNIDISSAYPDTVSDKAVESYGVDTATTVAMYATTIGVGLVSAIKVRNAMKAAREARVASELAHKVVPLGESGAAKVVKGGETYDVSGRASDGRLVLKAAQAGSPVDAGTAPGATGTAGEAGTTDGAKEQKPFAEVKPENFDLKKAKFGDFTPIKLDGKNYYANKEGTVFEYSKGMLKETAETRKLLLHAEEGAPKAAEAPLADGTPKAGEGTPKAADGSVTEGTPKPADGAPKPADGEKTAPLDKATPSVSDRLQKYPEIKAGVEALMKQGKADLASQILELKELGKLSTRTEAYLSDSGAARLSDPARVELVAQMVAESRSEAKLGDTMGGAGEKTIKGTVETTPKIVTGERHDTLVSPDGAPKGTRAGDLMVTVSHTDSGGVTTTRKVSLLELPKEEIGRKLTELNPERLDLELKHTREKLELAEAQKRTADIEKLKEQLNSLNDLKTMRESFELSKKSGKEGEFLAETHAKMKGVGRERAAFGALTKVGVASALMLLFNDLVPEFRFDKSGSTDRVQPGSTGG